MKQEKNNLKVAVMMCCYNGQEYLNEAIQSVLNQSYSNWKLYFWDNQSTDKSAEIFNSYKDKRLNYFLAKDHTNLGGSRSGALDIIEGDLIAILDTDDLWEKNKLEQQVKHFDDEKVGISISNTIFFNKKKSKIAFAKSPPQGYVYYELIKKYYISLETVIIRKSFVDMLEVAFNRKYDYICDMDLLIRLSKICKLSYDHQCLSRWRYHDTSLTSKDPKKFIIEKKKLLSDLDLSNSKNEKKYLIARKKFKENLLISDLINQIIENRRTNFIKLVNEYRVINIKILFLFFISILPLGKKMIIFIRKNYGMII
tara:strand:+ start:52938 stop:53873 length:936 start_codon:yes stop_codon:yes gene_type:complete